MFYRNKKRIILKQILTTFPNQANIMHRFAPWRTIPLNIRLFILAIMLFTCIKSDAQKQWITGNITDNNGKPISFATIAVKGSENITSTKADGFFIVKATLYDSVIVSAINYETKIFEINTTANAVLMLTTKTNALPDVTVTTAFDVKRLQRTAPYAAQVIPPEVINIIPQTNLNDALVGKIAGVQYRSQSGAKLNSQAFARLRGGILLGGDAAPVFVVDGTIVLDGNSIDPSTIENITVLKGANATAIFGGFINGAIVVTTKKGKLNKSSIVFSQGITIDKVGKLPHFQNVYAGGSNGFPLTQYTWETGDPEEWKALDGKYYHDYTDDASWGPKMEGQEYVPWYAWVPGHQYSFKTASLVPQPNNIKDFWETGITSNTNLGFSKAGEGYNARLSFNKQVITGVIPNSKADRNIVTAHLDIDINKFISTGVDLSYNRQVVYGDFNDGFINTTTGNFYQWNHRQLDMGIMKELRSLLTPAGTTASWNWNVNPNGYVAADPRIFYRPKYWFNFYTFLDNELLKQNSSRLIGNAYLKANITADLDVKATIRMDESNITNESQVNSLLWPLVPSYSTSLQSVSLINYELLLSYRKPVNKKIRVNAIGGTNIATYKLKTLSDATSGGLLIPNLYDIYNSLYPPSINNGRIESKSNAIFASGEIEYNQWISASVATRQLWHSALPANNNSLFCPSAGLSFFPFELLKGQPQWLSFLKLYASWGKTPLTPGVYQTSSYFIGSGQWGTSPRMTAGDIASSNNLKGGLLTSYETGIDMRLMKNRIGFTINYYHEIAADQPRPINIDATGGFAAEVANAATVKRTGLEFLLNASLIKNKTVTWNITVPVGWLLSNPVTKIVEGQERVQPTGWKSSLDRNSFASVYQVLNEDWGQLSGGAIVRNEAGIPLLNDTTALFINADASYNYGSVVPKFTGGFQSFFTYKNVFFNFSIDYQHGGKFYSCSEFWGNYSGTLAPSAGMNENGMNVRDDVAEGGGVHVVGISALDGKLIDTSLSAYTYFRQFRTTRIAEPYIHSLSYVKLRELSIGYNLPVTKWKFTQGAVQRATIAFIARNPWLIYSASENFDPSEISTVYGEEGQLPPVKSYGLSLNVTF